MTGDFLRGILVGLLVMFFAWTVAMPLVLTCARHEAAALVTQAFVASMKEAPPACVEMERK